MGTLRRGPTSMSGWRARALRLAPAAVLLAVACQQHHGGSAEAGGSAAPQLGAGAPSAAVARRQPPDSSLAATEYVAMGLPAAGRSWSGADMRRAAAVLGKLSKSRPAALPRLGSKRSGAVFARIASTANLDLHRDPSLPLGQRFPDLLDYIQSLGAIAKIYLAAFSAGRVADEDVAEILGAVMHPTVVMFDLVDELMPRLDKNDPSYATRMAGLARARAGAASVVTGSLDTLTERGAYGVAARRRLLGHMLAVLPLLVPRLAAGPQQEVRLRLGKMAADASHRDLQPELGKLAQAVAGARAAPAASSAAAASNRAAVSGGVANGVRR